MISSKLVMSAKEVAETLGCSERLIRKWSRECIPPQIPSFMLTRKLCFLREEIEAWVRLVALHGTVDDRALAQITTSLIKQRPGLYNVVCSERTSVSSSNQHAPTGIESQKAKAVRMITEFRKNDEEGGGAYAV